MICLLAFKSKTKGNLYLEYALNLIKKIQSESNLPITLMTDDKSYFKNKMVHIIEKENPTYTDKLKVCKIALNYGYTAVYIDVDTTLDFKLLEKMTFEGGLHFWWWWKTNLRRYEQIIDRRNFKKIEDYCVSNELEIEQAQLIHEGFFVISKSDYVDDFFNLFDDLAPLAIQQDIEMGVYPAGRAEGLLMGISLKNTGFKTVGCSKEMILLGHKLQQDKGRDKKDLSNNIDIDILDKKSII